VGVRERPLTLALIIGLRLGQRQVLLLAKCEEPVQNGHNA